METNTKPSASIMDRIRKCLNLADITKGATEHEALAAMSAAKKLMREHNLEMSDVELKQEAAAGATVTIDKRHRKVESAWEVYLARGIDSLFGTRHYTTKQRGETRITRVAFVGVGQDSQLAAESFAILVDIVYGMGCKYTAGVRGKEQTSYCLGVVNTLNKRAAESVPHEETQEAKNEDIKERGIMVIKNAVIETKLKSLGLRSGRRSNVSVNGDAYNRGKADGHTVDMNFRRAIK